MLLQYLDRLCSEFTTVKRVVIYSKSLRVPQVLVSLALIVGVIGFEVVYKLHFLDPVPMGIALRSTFSPTLSNWWQCEIERGTCISDVPAKDQMKYCSEPVVQKFWNASAADYTYKPVSIPCRYFNTATDQQEISSQLRVSTHTVETTEVHMGTQGWGPARQAHAPKQRLLVGAEQLVEFQGDLPGDMPVGGGAWRLVDLQGFIKYAGQTKRRRIRCAGQRRWLPNCPHVPFPEYWVRSYGAVSGSSDSSGPDMTFNGTGCVVVVDDHLYCHISELLRAAGIGLEDRDPHDRLRRVIGLTMEVKVTLENAGSADFWSWPIGLKPCFVLEVQAKGEGDVRMYTSYRQGSNASERQRTEYYGIALSLSSSTSWAKFSKIRLIGVVFVALGMMKYANLFVTRVLVSTYRWTGHGHVSALYEYNAWQQSPKDLSSCRHAAEFRERHRAVEEEHLNELMSWGWGDTSARSSTISSAESSDANAGCRA